MKMNDAFSSSLNIFYIMQVWIISSAKITLALVKHKFIMSFVFQDMEKA